MDIKLKNNRETRIKIVTSALLVFTAVTLCFFPGVNQRARAGVESVKTEEEERKNPDKDLLRLLYKGCYVLDLETANRQGEKAGAERYLEIVDGDREEEEIFWQQGNEQMERISETFEPYRQNIDYCVVLGEGAYEKNTSHALENVVLYPENSAEMKKLTEYYNDFFVLKFDESGAMSIPYIYSAGGLGDQVIKMLGSIDRDNEFWASLESLWDSTGIRCEIKALKNFTVVYGIPASSEYQISATAQMDEETGEYTVWSYLEAGVGYTNLLRIYSDAGAGFLYGGMFLLITLLMLLMTSKKIWKEEIPMQRPGNWYVMEAAVIGFCSVLGMSNVLTEMIWKYRFMMSYSVLWQSLTGKEMFSTIADILTDGATIFLVYAVWYLSLRFLRPVFTLGLREYIRQYSYIYQIFPWLKTRSDQFREEVEHIDFSEKSTKTIVKIVVVNFVILSVCSFLWFFGTFVLIVYSVGLFYLIKKYYDKCGADYQKLLRGVGRIAQGDLETEIPEDLGIFEPFKAELGKIRYGFKRAVDEEIKSQRMKTELITNVSHDLKTPLTAITTYVALLKKEDITEEERSSYIETLEQKALRLRVLIDDLFEVSKVTSNSIIFQRMELDVVNLLKQVSIEYAEKFAETGLKLRWNVPEEKVVVMLDNQKTYRIFENLFVNVTKYAMPESRVYVDVKVIPEVVAGYGSIYEYNGQATGMAIALQQQETEGIVEIAIKNMSAAELNFDTDEITERFVRGDASRNTEGSGLGLAIAKTFTEAQGGKLYIEVDGDLFKVVIQWKCGTIKRSE